LLLPPTVKRRSAGRPPPMARPRSEAQRGSVSPPAMRSTQLLRVGARPGGQPRHRVCWQKWASPISLRGETVTVVAAIVLLCCIGLALFGIVALGEWAIQRWYGGEMPVGGVI
jgi:hypothetical protein